MMVWEKGNVQEIKSLFFRQGSIRMGIPCSTIFVKRLAGLSSLEVRHHQPAVIQWHCMPGFGVEYPDTEYPIIQVKGVCECPADCSSDRPRVI